MDLYQTLGVSRDADAGAIRTAYRKLAKKHHPDLNPGDKVAEERFKSIASAHDLLSDPDKRARYDRGEIDDSGEEIRRQRPGRPSRPGQGRTSRPGTDDMSGIFADYFRDVGDDRFQADPSGRDVHYSLDVDFIDAVLGASRRIGLPDGQGLEVRIPAGIEAGQSLRLRGKGGPGRDGAPAGDALIEIHIRPHAWFHREGSDITLELPVSLTEAVLGGKISVPTPAGPVSMAIPPGSDTGTRLRLRGRGIPAKTDRPAGDQYVTLKVVLDPNDSGLAEFLKERPVSDFDPRKAMS